MKKALLSLVVLFAMVMFGATQAMAQTSDTVAVTVTITQSLVMTLTPPNWAVSSTSLNDTEPTWVSGIEGHFTLGNTGNGPQDYEISAGISGGSSLGTGAGSDQYAIGWGQAANPYTVEGTYTNITDTDESMISDMASSASDKFDMQIKTPTDTAYAGVEQTITVTITASAAL